MKGMIIEMASMQIAEIKVYEYDTKKEMEREINALKNSEWKVQNTYEFLGKWRAEYYKSNI